MNICGGHNHEFRESTLCMLAKNTERYAQRLVTAQPDRFAAVVAANTFLPTGDGKPSDAFLAWQRFSQEVPEMPRTPTLEDSVGLPRSACTSCSLMPSRTLAKLSSLTFEHAARASASTSIQERNRIAPL